MKKLRFPVGPSCPVQCISGLGENARDPAASRDHSVRQSAVGGNSGQPQIVCNGSSWQVISGSIYQRNSSSFSCAEDRRSFN